jgi:hypothetical protein
LSVPTAPHLRAGFVELFVVTALHLHAGIRATSVGERPERIGRYFVQFFYNWLRVQPM